jgi:LAGLIDADG endonuclease
MIEKEMKYRGSKSDLILKSVKEQRVDGSWYSLYNNNLNKMYLRCTLMNFERNYPVKILSNRINVLRTYITIVTHESVLVHKPKINPWFLSGFADAESSFSILIQPNSKYKTNWRIKAIFAIGLHKKDIELLKNIQSSLGVGKLHKHGKNSVQYRVESIKDLQVIVDYFDKYPLISVKAIDYILFKKAFYIIKLQEHLTKEGLLKLIRIKSSLNLGLSNSLKEKFPNWNEYPVTRPEYIFKGIPDPNWIAGFSSGDGSFGIKISSSITTKIGKRIQLRFEIGLNIREKELIKAIAIYFKLGNYKEDDKMSYIYYINNSVNFQVTKYSNIHDIIIPFFNKYLIQGQKSLDFFDFVKVVNMLKNKEHLTLEGFNKILKIKASMNEERI